MTKRYILGTSLGQFVLEKATTLKTILEGAKNNDIITLSTITDGGDKSETSLNLNEVKIYGYYDISVTKKPETKKTAPVKVSK